MLEDKTSAKEKKMATDDRLEGMIKSVRLLDYYLTHGEKQELYKRCEEGKIDSYILRIQEYERNEQRSELYYCSIRRIPL